MTDLVVGVGGFSTIQAAINAAAAGDRILVSAGTYGQFFVDRSVTIIGQGDVRIVGSFLTDNEIPLNTSVASWITSAEGYSNDSGAGAYVLANNVTISNLKFSSFTTGVWFDGASNLTLDHVQIDNVLFGVQKGGGQWSSGFQMLGGSISNAYMGIDIEAGSSGPIETLSVPAGASAAAPVDEPYSPFDNVVIDGVAFSHITAKGIYADTLSNAQIMNLSMIDVGQYGLSANLLPWWESYLDGRYGAGIDINIGSGDFHNILIDNFNMRDVGTNHYPWSGSAGIAIRSEGGISDFESAAPAAAPVSTNVNGVLITNGLIHNTATAYRLGSDYGEDYIGSRVTVQNVVVDQFGTATLDNDTNQTLLVFGSTGNDILQSSSSTYGSLSIHGVGGNDLIVGGWNDDTLDGGAGDDIIVTRGGVDNVIGGTGNDGVYFGDYFNQEGGGDTSPADENGAAAVPYLDRADGGPGIDTIALQGHYNLTTLSNLINFEVLLVASGSDTQFEDLDGGDGGPKGAAPQAILPPALDYYNLRAPDSLVAPGTIFTVIATGLKAGETLIFDGSPERDGAFTIFAGQGLNILRGGAGDDGFMFGGNVPTSADRIDGGAGYDVIAFRGDYSGAHRLVMSPNLITNVEGIAFLSGHTHEYGGVVAPGGFDYDVIMSDGNVGLGQRLDIFASGLAADESLYFDGRAETNGSYRIIGGAGDDTIYGGNKDDLIYGGLGADHMDGGTGADTYIYRSAAESTATSTDTIDFNVGDKIDLSALPGTFSFIGANAFGHVADQLRVFQVSDGHWQVQADLDGNGVADLVINVNSANPLTADSFVL